MCSRLREIFRVRAIFQFEVSIQCRKIIALLQWFPSRISIIPVHLEMQLIICPSMLHNLFDCGFSIGGSSQIISIKLLIVVRDKWAKQISMECVVYSTLPEILRKLKFIGRLISVSFQHFVRA